MDGAIVELGYLGIEASQPEAWRDFLTASVGLEESADSLGSGGYRMDARVRRIIVEPGEADDVAYSGWLASDAAALAVLQERLSEAGLSFIVHRERRRDARAMPQPWHLRLH